MARTIETIGQGNASILDGMRVAYRPTPDRAVLIGAILTAAIYCRDLRYDFVLDDQALILVNETLASWRNWKTLFTTHIFSSVATPIVYLGPPPVHYRPIFMLWLMTISRLSGVSTPWLHLVSLLLHILVVSLVYVLARKILENDWAAALTALLFAFHPVHVEPVAYISASSDLLVTLFVLVSLLSYVRFREHAGKSLFWFLSIASAALAMLSKETGAMIPWILVAYEFFRGSEHQASPTERRYLWALPHFVIVAGYVAIRSHLFGPSSWPGSDGRYLRALADIPLVLLVYLRNLLWPFHLSLIYPSEWSSRWTAVRAIFIVLITAGGIWLWLLRSDRRLMRVQLVWTAILFIPALTAVFAFVQDDWVHDRHMYLVSVPFCMLIARLLLHFVPDRRFSIAAAAVVSVTFLTTTFLNVPRFSDELALYESAMKVSPNSPILHKYYASALFQYGHKKEALLEFQKRILLTPESPNAHEEYAAALSSMGQEEEAATQFEKVLQLAGSPTPYRAFVLYRLAVIELNQGKAGSAASRLSEAIRIDPQRPNYHAALVRAVRAERLNEDAED